MNTLINSLRSTARFGCQTPGFRRCFFYGRDVRAEWQDRQGRVTFKSCETPKGLSLSALRPPLRTHLPRLSPVTRIKGRFSNAGVPRRALAAGRLCDRMKKPERAAPGASSATPAYLHSRRPERHTTHSEVAGSLPDELRRCGVASERLTKCPPNTSAGGGLHRTATGPRLDRR